MALVLDVISKNKGEFFNFFFEIKKKLFHIFVSFKWLLKEKERRRTCFHYTCIHLFSRAFYVHSFIHSFISLFKSLNLSLQKSWFYLLQWKPFKIYEKCFFFILKALFVLKIFNPLSANFTKWSNTLKQFVGKLPKNCLSVFDHFVGLALKGLKVCLSWHENSSLHFNENCKKMTLTRWRFTITTR